MFVSIGEYVAIGLVVIIAIVFAAAARDHRNVIECPKCGYHFKQPSLSVKEYGASVGDSHGDFICPKCSHKGPDSSFRIAGSETEQKSK
jgi:predicted RNA-binding Zn-ribbon protein involved in translation (DUF1610 family)